MRALTITATSLRRYLRDRTAFFFVVVLPVLVIVIVGSTVGGFDRFDVAVVDQGSGPLATELVDALEQAPAIKVHRVASVDSARTSVRRGENAVAIVIPAGFDDGLARGQDQQLTLYADRNSSTQQAAASAVSSVIADQAGRIQAARFASDNGAGSFAADYELTAKVATTTPSVEVTTSVVGTARHTLPEGFSYSAPTMLVLFVFINALAGGGAIIRTRDLGLYERMLAAPLRTRSIVLGETLCYLSLALLQSVLIVGVGAFVFDVDWGDTPAAAALVAIWALVGTGAGVLSGTLFRTPQQAASIGPSVGIALGMLGGCMWPLEIVPNAMRVFGHLFPHAWAIDAWTTLLSRGGDLLDIARPLAVLGGFAVALLAISTTRLHHTVAR